MPYDIFGYYLSEEHKAKISRTMKEKGIHVGINNPHCKPIIQLTLKGDFVRRWDYIGEALEHFGKVGSPLISSVCRGVSNKKIRNKSAYGFKWMFEEDYLLYKLDLIEA